MKKIKLLLWPRIYVFKIKATLDIFNQNFSIPNSFAFMNSDLEILECFIID